MGAGTNVQDRLIALHHLDVPWRPSEGDLYVDDDTLKIKLTSEEFLSGFRKEDKLIPSSR